MLVCLLIESLSGACRLGSGFDDPVRRGAVGRCAQRRGRPRGHSIGARCTARSVERQHASNWTALQKLFRVLELTTGIRSVLVVCDPLTSPHLFEGCGNVGSFSLTDPKGAILNIGNHMIFQPASCIQVFQKFVPVLDSELGSRCQMSFFTERCATVHGMIYFRCPSCLFFTQFLSHHVIISSSRAICTCGAW